MKIKTSELSGIALDWVVAKCEGVETIFRPLGHYSDGDFVADKIALVDIKRGRDCYYSPSSDWSQGGPIIERERINILQDARIQAGKEWIDTIGVYRYNGYGSTPLIAAVRCYVASKLGEEVEIPDELL